MTAQIAGWRFVGHNELHTTEARIRQEVQEALRRFRGGSSPAWVAVSRVSSALSEETREALADLGGLGSFCRRPQQAGEARFAVKSVDGVLCVKLHDVGASPPRARCGKANRSERIPGDVRELQRICSRLPESPVTLSACRRVWKLPSRDATAQHLVNLMERVDTVLKRCSSPASMSMYVQVGYEGNQAVVVGSGPQLASVAAECTSKNSGEGEGDETQRWEAEDFSPEYDLWRFSRFLQTDRFVPINEVRRLTEGVLQTSLLQVAMSYPERILLQLGPTTRAEAANADRLYVNGAACGELCEVCGVKFLLSKSEIEQNLSKRSSKLSGLTAEELQAEREKLKQLPPLRRQKSRRAIVREEFRRRYPCGNAFLNPNVVAFHVYDQMTPGVWLNNSTVRDTLLPDGGKGCMHVGVDFFDRFPHLFITQGITTTSLNVMRREQGMEFVPSDGESWKHVVFCDEEILLFLLPRLTNKKEDWGESKYIAVLTSLFPRHVFKYLRSRGDVSAQLIAILRRYPEAFEVIETDAKGDGERENCKVLLRYDGIVKLGAQLVNMLQADGSQKETEEAVEGSDGKDGGSLDTVTTATNL